MLSKLEFALYGFMSRTWLLRISIVSYAVHADKISVLGRTGQKYVLLDKEGISKDVISISNITMHEIQNFGYSQKLIIKTF